MHFFAYFYWTPYSWLGIYIVNKLPYFYRRYDFYFLQSFSSFWIFLICSSILEFKPNYFLQFYTFFTLWISTWVYFFVYKSQLGIVMSLLLALYYLGVSLLKKSSDFSFRERLIYALRFSILLVEGILSLFKRCKRLISLYISISSLVTKGSFFIGF